MDALKSGEDGVACAMAGHAALLEPRDSRADRIVLKKGRMELCAP
jgi:hypothetical protein